MGLMRFEGFNIWRLPQGSTSVLGYVEVYILYIHAPLNHKEPDTCAFLFLKARLSCPAPWRLTADLWCLGSSYVLYRHNNTSTCCPGVRDYILNHEIHKP